MEVLCGCAWSRKSVRPFNFSLDIPWRSASTHTIDGIRFNQAALKNSNRAVMLTSFTLKGHDGGILRLVMNESPTKFCHSQFTTLLSPEHIKNEEVLSDSYEEPQLHNADVSLLKQADNSSGFGKGSTNMRDKETERRRKIGLGNKGKKPWNKGITHNEETRKLISERTIEALRDPKVRKKMSEHSRSHSDQSKARMSSTMKKIWEERLRERRLQEKCYLTWKQSIAEAAKDGIHDQEKLEWDSYERIKSEVVTLYLQQKTEKAKAKEIAKLRKEEAAKARAEAAKVRAAKAAKSAQLRKEKEKAKAREMRALVQKKSQDTKVKSESLKLKARLTKFHHRKRQLQSSVNIQRSITVELQPVIQNLDIDQIRIEKMRRISFGDQIQAAKSRKADFNSFTIMASTNSMSSSELKPGDS